MGEKLMNNKDFDIDFSLKGKTAIITGGASGIGRATAEMFIKKGADVAIIDVNKDTVKIAAEISRDILAVRADITSTSEIDRAIEAVSCRFGKINVLCNIAGLGHSENAEDINESDWGKVVAVNMTALFFMCQRVGRYMIGQGTGGKIINMSSQAGVVGLAQHACYGATKAAVINITKTLAGEWGKYKINVNAVSPTVILTPMCEEYWSGERAENMLTKIPIGRFGAMNEAAACFVYLASDAANLITGANLVIDGGFTAV
jgi:NAD(P)-dependent dehydrogenase (short-subunit alcohol dehydrogenase family)